MKAIFLWAVMTTLPPKDLVAVLLIFTLQEGAFALLSPTFNAFILRSGTKLNSLSIISMTIVAFAFAALLAPFIFFFSDELGPLLYYPIAIFVCKSLPLLLAKYNMAKGRVTECFLITFFVDTIGFGCITLLLLTSKLEVQLVFAVYTVILLIVFAATLHHVWSRKFGIKLFLEDTNRLMTYVVKTITYGPLLAFWFALERIVFLKLDFSEMTTATFFIYLRAASFVVGICFGYFAAIKFEVILRSNVQETREVLMSSLLLIIGLVSAGFIACVFFGDFVFGTLFPTYAVNFNWFDLFVCSTYVLFVNFLLFLNQFFERVGLFIVPILSSVIVSTLLLFNWAADSALTFYLNLTAIFGAMCLASMLLVLRHDRK